MKDIVRAILLGLPLLLWTAVTARSGQLEDGQTAYDNGDYATALGLWRPLAERGNANAEYNLGLIYQRGNGVPKDDQEAVKWFRKAADQGLVEAEFTLGWIYHDGTYGEGTEVAQDYSEAFKWLRKAAGQGDAHAQQLLAGM